MFLSPLSKIYLEIVLNADVSADDLFIFLMGIETPQYSWWIPDDGESSSSSCLRTLVG